MVESLQDIYRSLVPIDSIVNIENSFVVKDIENNLLNFNMSMIESDDKVMVALRSTDFRPPVFYDGKLSYISIGYLDEDIINDLDIIRLNGYGIRLWDKYNAMEDPRLVHWKNDIWCLFTRPNFYITKITMAMVNLRTKDYIIFDDPLGREFTKNWMPYVNGEDLYFVTDTDPLSVYQVVDKSLKQVFKQSNKVYDFNIHGSSNVINFKDRLVALVHGREMSDGKWQYWHRFVSWNSDWTNASYGKPFFFEKRGVEFSLCLFQNNDMIIIPYSVDDRNINIIKINNKEFRKLL